MKQVLTRCSGAGALIAVAIGVVAGCYSAGQPLGGKVNLGSSEAIAAQIARCPSWVHVPRSDKRAREEITTVYTKLAMLPDTDLRAGISLYLRNSDTFDAKMNVFALLRVIFVVPRRLDTKDAPRYHVWGNPINSDGTRDFLWPFSLDERGLLQLTGEPENWAFGAFPDMLTEYDAMDQTLRRRFPPSR